MPKKIIYILTGLLFIVTGLFIIPNLINWEYYKSKITQEINASSPDYKLSVNGKMHVKLLPWPTIIFKDCYIENPQTSKKKFMLEAANIKGKFSLLFMLLGKVQVNNITVVGGKAYLLLDNNKNGLLFDRNKNRALNIQNVIFRKSDISLIKGASPIATLNNSNINVQLSAKNLTINGNFSPTKFEILNINFKLMHDKSDAIKIETTINSPTINLQLTGKLNSQPDNWNVTGQSNISIKNLSNFSQKYLTNFLPFFNYINSPESLDMQSNILISEEEITFKDINIKSNSIEASGTISDLITNSPVIDINLVFNKLDFDLLGKQNAPSTADLSEQKALHNLIQTTPSVTEQYNFILPKNVDLLLYLDIKDAIYNGQHLSNAKINAELSQGVIELYYLLLNFGKDAKIELGGTLTSNNIRPSFAGIVDARGSNLTPIIKFLGYNGKLLQNEDSIFNFYGKIIATPKELKLYRIDSGINQLSVRGNLILRMHKQLHIDADLEIHSLNLDDYAITQKLSDLVQLTQAENYSYLENLQWLRTVKFDASLSLNIKNLIMNKYTIEHVNTNINISPSLMEIENISIKAPDIELDGNIGLNIRYLRPKILIDFKGNKYDHNLITKKLFPSPQDSTSNKTQPGHQPWSNKVIPFNAINTFDGEIKLNIDNVIIDNLSLEQFDFAGKLSNYVLYLNNLKTKVFGGDLSMTGLLSTQPMIISMSYALNNIFAEQLLSKLFNINSISGYLSTNGSFTTQGNTEAMMISHLNSEFLVAARQIQVEGLNIDLLVNSTTNTNYNIQDFDNMLQSALKGTTVFNSIDGKFNITQGLLQTKALEMTTNRTRGGLSGNVDLRNWLVNIITEIAFIPKVDTQPVSFTVNMTGSIDKMDKKIQADTLKNYLMTNHQ